MLTLNNKKLVRCNKCALLCVGNALKIDQLYFHEECLVCKKCQINLKDIEFYKIDGDYICVNDYETTMLKCAYCNLKLSGSMVEINGKKFHCHCITCFICNATLNPGLRVTYWNKKFFCMNCYENQNSQVATKLSPDNIHKQKNLKEILKNKNNLQPKIFRENIILKKQLCEELVTKMTAQYRATMPYTTEGIGAKSGSGDVNQNKYSVKTECQQTNIDDVQNSSVGSKKIKNVSFSNTKFTTKSDYLKSNYQCEKNPNDTQNGFNATFSEPTNESVLKIKNTAQKYDENAKNSEMCKHTIGKVANAIKVWEFSTINGINPAEEDVNRFKTVPKYCSKVLENDNKDVKPPTYEMDSCIYKSNNEQMFHDCQLGPSTYNKCKIHLNVADILVEENINKSGLQNNAMNQYESVQCSLSPPGTACKLIKVKLDRDEKSTNAKQKIFDQLKRSGKRRRCISVYKTRITNNNKRVTKTKGKHFNNLEFCKKEKDKNLNKNVTFMPERIGGYMDKIVPIATCVVMVVILLSCSFYVPTEVNNEILKEYKINRILNN